MLNCWTYTKQIGLNITHACLQSQYANTCAKKIRKLVFICISTHALVKETTWTSSYVVNWKVTKEQSTRSNMKYMCSSHEQVRNTIRLVCNSKTTEGHTCRFGVQWVALIWKDVRTNVVSISDIGRALRLSRRGAHFLEILPYKATQRCIIQDVCAQLHTVVS